MFKAYLVTHDGKRLPGYVEIEDDPNSVLQYLKIQSSINPTVTVTDKNDMVVAKMVDAKLVFPETDPQIDFRKLLADEAINKMGEDES